MLFRPSIRSEAYATATVRTWLEENSRKIKLFHLPICSPELNPDEYLNRDVKASLAEKKRPRTAKAQKADVVAHLKSCSAHIGPWLSSSTGSRADELRLWMLWRSGPADARGEARRRCPARHACHALFHLGSRPRRAGNPRASLLNNLKSRLGYGITRVCHLKISKSRSRPCPHAFSACGLHNNNWVAD